LSVQQSQKTGFGWCGSAVPPDSARVHAHLVNDRFRTANARGWSVRDHLDVRITASIS
jgi:hypothetical protein